MTRKDYRIIARGLRHAPEFVVDETCYELRNACPSFNEDKFRAFIQSLYAQKKESQ